MTAPRYSSILRRLASLVDGGPAAESDAALLLRFRDGRDEAAFGELVRRHGPMVRGVGLTVLRNLADADDAFQAAFLTLARRAGSIRRPGSLAGWLCGVAYRVARKAQARDAKRRAGGGPVPEPAAPPADDLTWNEVQCVLYEELDRLARRHRDPLVACYLQGRTQDEAAGLLGLSKGTLKRRLEEGRALLRAALVRRGLGPAAALAASAWPGTSAAVPVALVATTARTAALTGGRAAAGLVSAEVAALVEAGPAVGAKAAVLAALAAAAVGTGAAVFAGPAAPAVDHPPPAKPAAVADRPAVAVRQVAGVDLYGDPLPPGAVARMGTVRFRSDNGTFDQEPVFSPRRRCRRPPHPVEAIPAAAPRAAGWRAHGELPTPRDSIPPSTPQCSTTPKSAGGRA